MSVAWARLVRRLGVPGIRPRQLVTDANDGIIAAAGIVEGFSGAGFGRSAVFVATFSAMLAGAIALGGARFVEAASERDEILARLAHERRLLARDPAEELAELVEHHQAKGLSPALAEQVADELTRHDALTAHAEAELGIDLQHGVVRPLPVALICAAGFAAGAAVPLLVAVLTEDNRRAAATFAAVVVSLALTSYLQARAGHVSVLHTVVRTVSIGVIAMVVTYLAGLAFHL